MRNLCKDMTYQRLQEARVARPPTLADYGYAIQLGAPDLFTVSRSPALAMPF